MSIDKALVVERAKKIVELSDVKMDKETVINRAFLWEAMDRIGISSFDPVKGTWESGETVEKLTVFNRANMHTNAANSTVNSIPNSSHIDRWVKVLPIQLRGLNDEEFRRKAFSADPKWKEGIATINANLEHLGFDELVVETGGKKRKSSIRQVEDTLTSLVSSADLDEFEIDV